MTRLTRRDAALLIACSPMVGCGPRSGAHAVLPQGWSGIQAQARGQTVHWYAWGGDPRINAYIAWVGMRLRTLGDITLVHVKAADTAGVLAQLLADKTAGRATDGRTDLIWINGENFVAAREADLLYGPFAQRLPNWPLVDTVGKPSTVVDFTVRTEGYESPWGLAQITFFHDAARVASPPRTLAALLDWTRGRPGRFTYPAPPDFVGVTFLKQALHDLMADPTRMTRAVDPETFEAVTAPLWTWLDALHPLLWRRGQAFPPDYPALRQLLEDQETDLAFAFNPAEAAGAVAAGRLPPTTRAYVLEGGTIQNSHFVAIPFNAPAKAAALVTADFLLSPEAQARKADPVLWGDPSVLALDRLLPADRARFEALPQAAALPPAADLGRNIPEPHGSWHLALETAWRRRYAT